MDPDTQREHHVETHRHTDTEGRQRVKMEAELGVMLPQARN